jgi:hypothetical protein
MAKIFPGRMTHKRDGGLVVFMIGMRVNKPWRLDQWIPPFLAMGPMLAELLGDPESGLLGGRITLGSSGPVLIQYWASKEHLYRYASERDHAHRPAWSAFNARARKAPGAVGIWHETFQVESAETMYVGMPAYGLAQATEHVAVTQQANQARDRMRAGRTKAAS